MNKLEHTIKDIHITDDAGEKRAGKGEVHPLSRFLVTIVYILSVLSFSKYDFTGLAGMLIYILIQCIWYEISIKNMMKRIWPVLLLMGLVGIANPFLDREACVSIGVITLSYGMISMLTLMLKGMLCVIASYILVMSIGIRQICYAMKLLRVPEEIVTILLLMHRYLIVLIKELEKMQQAYKLRAPGQRGLRIGAWGSFVGLLLLRSIDRAQEVHESMKLRGYRGTMQYSSFPCSKGLSVFYVIVWGSFFLLFRIFSVFRFVGGLLL